MAQGQKWSGLGDELTKAVRDAELGCDGGSHKGLLAPE